MNIAMRFFVSGRVQGVFFRASTRQQAERLGLRGWAVNLPDGRVEVLAVGPAAAVQQLGEWLHDGPPAAKVLGVETAPADSAEVSGRKGFNCG
jgi:acylphosphatase